MKILVTGVNGYIGSRVAERMVAAGHDVCGIDVVSDARAPAAHPHFSFHKADITDPESLSRVPLERVDALIHCAALVHKNLNTTPREEYFRVNREGTRTLLARFERVALGRVVFLSTVSVYGNLTKDGVPDVWTAPAPADSYGESKAAAEDDIREFASTKGVPFVILRLAPVYGPHFLLNVTKRICLAGKGILYRIGGGNQRLSLCSVRNILDLTEGHALSDEACLNRVFIVKDPKDYSVNEIIATFRKAFQRKYGFLIPIPSKVAGSLVEALRFVSPHKARFYRYQLDKITRDCIYSDADLKSAGINLKWDLETTLLDAPDKPAIHRQ